MLIKSTISPPNKKNCRERVEVCKLFIPIYMQETKWRNIQVKKQKKWRKPSGYINNNNKNILSVSETTPVTKTWEYRPTEFYLLQLVYK